MLPQKPIDSAGRKVNWVLLCQSPGFVYDGQWVAVDESFLAEQLSDFERLTASGYAPPVLREHKRAGERAGDVLQLAVADVAGAPSLVAAVALADSTAPQKIQDGAIKYVSPSFGPLEDDKGHKYNFVLREVSLVASPHQKHIGDGATHILASEITMKTEEQLELDTLQPQETAPAEELETAQEAAEELETAQELEAAEVTAEEWTADKVQGLLLQLEARLSAMEDRIRGEEAEEEEEEESAGCELTERISALELERDQALWAHVDHKKLKVTAQLSELLFEVWRRQKSEVGAILDKATIKRDKAASTPDAPANPFALRLSEPAPLTDAAPATDEDLSRQALQLAEGNQRKALEIYKQLKLQQLQQ